MKNVVVVFPNLWEVNENGLIFSSDSVGILDLRINDSDVPVLVTAYDSKAEYQYAIGSTYRYATVDPMFQVGTVISLNKSTGEMVLEVQDKFAEAIKSGKVLPRATVTKVFDETVNLERMRIENLIAIDIMTNIQEDN